LFAATAARRHIGSTQSWTVTIWGAAIDTHKECLWKGTPTSTVALSAGHSWERHARPFEIWVDYNPPYSFKEGSAQYIRGDDTGQFFQELLWVSLTFKQ